MQYRQTSSSGSETVEGRGNYTITGLTPFTSYSIRVAAVNSDGDTGPLSDSITVETLQDGKLYTWLASFLLHFCHLQFAL